MLSDTTGMQLAKSTKGRITQILKYIYKYIYIAKDKEEI